MNAAVATGQNGFAVAAIAAAPAGHHTTRAFHDQLAASAHGRFVLVSAKQAQQPSNGNAAYAAAKAAAEAWTLAYADGFGPGGATANIVVVDAILTPQMRAENPGKAYPTFTPAEHVADAIAWREADTLRAYVAAARRTSADGADIPRFEEWAQWALAAADRLDPISSGRELAAWCAQAESAADEDED